MIKLISVNIERAKHLELVLPFLEREQADVVCVQELYERDVPRFDSVIGGTHSFVPMMRYPEERERVAMGIGVFSRLPIANTSVSYYRGSPATVPDFDDTSEEAKSKTQNHMVLFCDIASGGSQFRIATTHFTWSERGQASAFQRTDAQKLLAILASSSEFVLCGDFNAPRGGEIFSQIAGTYKDNIPPEYKTSIDITLHRNGKTRPRDFDDKMVDGLFTTPLYQASDVHLEFGVSDHAAIVATIGATH